MAKLENKRILVSGCSGTVGSELIRQIVRSSKYNPSSVIGIDNNESSLFFQEQEYLEDSRVNFFLADIRDAETLSRQMASVDIVFHTAALKHVVMCERSPMDAVQTNIHGVQNIISAAIENNVSQVIFTSSDKAVNPTNVMGTTKLMGERLITAANSTMRGEGPIFSSTRFGNVLGSRGSVLPIFRNQIKKGGPVTITHLEMTRFIMTIEQSVQLVIESSLIAKGGEVFVTKMPVINIADLANVMIEELASQFGYQPSDIQLKIIGTKPGEKLYEELMNDEETRRSIELEEYYSVMPAFRGLYRDINYDHGAEVSKSVDGAYNSALEAKLSHDEIRDFLKQHNLLESIDDDGESTRRYWPGDKEEKTK